MARTVLRFAVVDPYGRRSAVWRIWTGKDGKKATDDVYIAPQLQIADYKISLHRDGMAQHGLSDAVRAQLRPGDKHALIRWELPEEEVFPGWRPLYLLQFPESELESIDLDDDVVRVPATSPGRAVNVAIFVGTPGTEVPAGLEDGVVAVLDRKDGGLVLVLRLDLPFDSAVLDKVDNSRGASLGWAVPSVVSEREPFGWIAHRGVGEHRSTTEFSALKRQAPSWPDRLEGFPGVIRPWSDVPAEIDHQDSACAVLVCSAEGIQLFVDTRSRCHHEHLAGDAAKLVSAYRDSRLDGGWGRLANGSVYTMISMPRVLDERGIGPWFHGPGSRD